MNSKLILWSITSALAGFLFGFDTVVISGAEQTIERLWGLTKLQHGAATSSALWGTVLGAILGSLPTDYFGRRTTLISVGILYLVSAVWSGLAVGLYDFIIARFIGGLGVGVATVAAPLYISEIAPAKRRGLLAGLFQFNIVFGILAAYVSNYLIKGVSEHDWRWMLGVEAIPAAIYMVMCFVIPESPRWLIAIGGDREAGKRVLRWIDPDASDEAIDAAVAQIALGDAEASTTSDTSSGQSTRTNIDSPYAPSAATPAHASAGSLNRPLMLAFMIAMFNQFSGINAILYFSTRIFESAGFADNVALLNSVGIGVTNLVFTFVGLWLIDRLGRRTLLMIGSIGYIASLGLCAWAFSRGVTSIIPWCIFAFIASHAVGQGAVIWVFISEIFPNRARALGQSVGSATHWVFAALITLLFPPVAALFEPQYIFGFFCGMMVLQLIWVLTLVPETKGVPLEQMRHKLGY